MSRAPLLLLFDAECPLCVNLAALVARRSAGAVACRAWQAWRESDAARATQPAALLARPADKLRALDDGRLLEGEAAWAAALSACPDLAPLQWMAAKLGLTRPAARAMQFGGLVARRAALALCPRCRQRS